MEGRYRVKEVRHASPPLIYAISTIFGAAFSLLLVMLAWQNALEAEKKEFAFDSILLRDTVKLSASAAHNSLYNIAALVEGLDASAVATLPAFLKSLLARNPFIESISFHRSGVSLNHSPKDMALRPDASGDPPPAGPTILWGSGGELYIGRNPAKEALYNDQILSDPRFTDALRAAVDTGMVVPGPPASDTERIRPYTLIKAIGAGPAQGAGADQRSNTVPAPFVAILVNPGHLFSESLLRDDVSVSLYTESQGVTGRQLVFEQRGAVAPENANFSIGAFKEETLAQFPYYSMKLVVEKQVLWREIDKGLIATAIVLGIGVTTLIVALARAREIQAWELSRRNQEIERQVSLQTKELAVTRDAAIKASTVKTEFLASMSHEIRTPLNAIIGMGELLSETPLTRVQKRYVGVFKKAGEALLALVNEILDLSKIEAGQLDLEEIPFNLRTLIEETVDIHALRADEKNLELLCHIGTDVPAQVKGDAARLRQILLNLVGNAIKFTQKGEVVVKVSPNPDISDPYRLLFSVEDTGIGIPADKIDTIFDSFSQADSSTTRQYGGTGLGLTISKRLVELMGGRIRAESVEGKGSVLSFAITLGSVPEPQARIATDAFFSLKEVRVLIIDDNSTNRLILREVLSAQGALVSEAHGGAEGIKLFREASRTGQDYAVVITDCRMPEVDGFAVVEALRTAGGWCKTILMVSSSQLSSDMSTASALGIGAYLIKPVKSVELIKAINVAMLKTLDETQDHIVTTPSLARRAENLPILLVEDTPDNRLLIKAYLRKTPYKIEEAENGSVALQKFKARAYGLVLMDIQMPVMDGHQATRAMREWETEQGRAPTPIIALTAHAIKQEMDKSITAGCTAHLIKPIKKETLLQIVQKCLPVSPAS
ncbi:MAG: response regulator [Pseudomonadota bacterium]|nr:response regulator [Pseudomonadota bacterium]